MVGFELGLKINFHGGGWVGGGWLDQMRIRLTSASTGVGVEVGAELGKNLKCANFVCFSESERKAGPQENE